MFYAHCLSGPNSAGKALWPRSGVEGSLDTGFPLMFTFPLALMVSLPSRRIAMNEAIGYVRVSSEEQADSGLGLQAGCDLSSARESPGFCLLVKTVND